MADLKFKPGVNKETTAYTINLGFTDSNLIRWRGDGVQTPVGAAPVNGWYRRHVTNIGMNGVCRAVKEWASLDGTNLAAYGTNAAAYVLSGDELSDITPAGFVAGSSDASIADGWGIGVYGAGTWGTPRTISSDPFSNKILDPLIWSLDNYGQDLLMCPYAGVGDAGPIYIWHLSGGFGTRATRLDADPLAVQVPLLARGVFVSTQLQCAIAAGCSPLGSKTSDPMQIRWSDSLNPYDWNPTSANNAGGYRLPSGSYIVGWLNTFYETLFFTDTTVYSMQLVTNGEVFGFPPVGRGMSLISPKAAISNGSVSFWMDLGSFYSYNGTVAELPCPLKEFLFGNTDQSGNVTPGDLNRLQSFKIHAAHNHSYSEIWWFYASAKSSEIDSYVMYNYSNGLWANGRLARTAWSDSGKSPNPMAVDPSGTIWMQEYGCDINNFGQLSPVPWSLTTGDFCIDQGDTFTLLERLIPDFLWKGTAGDYQQFWLDIRVRNTGSQTPRVAKSLVVTPVATANGGYLDCKARGRRVSFKFYNSDLPGTAWIMGTMSAQYYPNGRR